MLHSLLKAVCVSASLGLSLMSDSSLASTPASLIKNTTKTTINVGIYAPFSDKSAFIGRNILAAMEMARDQLNSADIEYSFYTLDELPDNKTTARTLQKFIDAHHINVLLTEGSTSGLVAAPLAKQSNILHFSMATDPAIADGTNNFLAWNPVSEQASVLVEELKRNKVQQLAIISSDNPSSALFTQNVIQQVQGNSPIKIAAHEQFKSGSKDFSTLVHKIKRKNSDFYFIMATPEEIGLIKSQMTNANIDKPITTIIERVTPKVMEVFDGQWYVDNHEMNPQFVKQFQEAYMNYPVTEAGYAYDVFHILHKSVVLSMKSNPTFSRQEVANQIHILAGGTGVMGTINFDKHGVLYTKSEIKQVKNGQVLTG